VGSLTLVEGAEKGGVLLLALASSGHRDGSLIRMKRIFLIKRIDHFGALVRRAGTPFFLVVCIEGSSWRTQPARAAVNKKSQPSETTLSRQAELEQYPINPKNPLHPDQTSVSVAR
jgi:hypothetical protein